MRAIDSCSSINPITGLRGPLRESLLPRGSHSPLVSLNTFLSGEFLKLVISLKYLKRLLRDSTGAGNDRQIFRKNILPSALALDTLFLHEGSRQAIGPLYAAKRALSDNVSQIIFWAIFFVSF